MLIDTEDADIANVMMAAGIDAARDVDAQLADFSQTPRVAESPADTLGNGNGAGIREVAVIEARAGDDIGDEADIGRRQLGAAQALPEYEKILLAHMRQHQILMMADTNLTEAVFVGEIGDDIHLIGGGVARGATVRLQRDID